jgi:hypothetical protein
MTRNYLSYSSPTQMLPSTIVAYTDRFEKYKYHGMEYQSRTPGEPWDPNQLVANLEGSFLNKWNPT